VGRTAPSVAILCANYAPESNAAARRITDLAHGLEAAGWSVEVVAQAPHHPQNRLFPGYGHRYRTIDREDNLTVVRYRPWIVPKGNFLLRFASELLFAVQAAVRAAARRPDLILASSPFMFLGPLGLLAARLAGVRFAWDVRDLTWLYLAATGRRAFAVDRLIGRLMRFTARRADALTTATHGILAYFEARPQRAEVVTNGLPAAFLERLRSAPRQRSPEEPPLVVYAGLLGYPQGLKVLIDVAERLPGVEVALVGDGPERSALMHEALNRGLANVTFPGFVEGTALDRWYGAADVLVAHLRRDPAFVMAQPSKLWEYMATGRPVVYGGEGEAVAILSQENIGLTVPPESAEGMAAAIRQLLEDPGEAARLGARGRAFVEHHRNRETLLERWEALLSATLRG
jgi:colanic acid biosynthesis glycosyl transferase WcaI